MQTSTARKLWTPRQRLLLWALIIIAAFLVLGLLLFVGQPACGCTPFIPVTIVPGLSG
jgi:hypothetical protein